MHTQGPWHVGMKQAERIVYDSKGWAVANATVYHAKADRDKVLANARLIAAAPDLLAALQALTQAVHTEYPEGAPFKFRRLLIEADETIAKATS